MYLFLFIVAISYILSISIVDAQHLKLESNCLTPNGTGGSCINIRQCLPLVTMLQEKPLRQETIDYLKRSQCGLEGHDPWVCCPTEFNSTVSSSILLNNPQTKVQNCTLENLDNNDPIIRLLNNPLIPCECGRDSIPRDLTAADTTPGEFPWLVLLEYKNGNETIHHCTGTLITNRYVLTAAHCLNNINYGKLINVRLGEHDLNSTKDCVKRDDDVITCSDDPITVEIEETISHELYLQVSRNREYDIGLVRLSRDIISTDYVKPICLPRSSVIDKRLYAAGWGGTLTSSSSNVKLKVSLPLVDKDSCYRIYRSRWNLKLGFEQICAGGEENRSACRGDSGGPLMTFKNLPNGDKIWTAVGIISFSAFPCGLSSGPSVSNKVYDFIPWIISKIRP